MAGFLLILGLWTPIAGASVAVIEVWKILTLPGDRWLWLLLGTVSVALAMLGPGLWSIDARLFGWKRVEAPPRKNQFYLLVSKLPKQPNFLAQKRLLLASQEVSICPDVGLCANGARWIIAFIDGTKRLSFKIQAMGLNKRLEFRGGGVMPEIENLKIRLSIVSNSPSSSNFLEEDIALEAFELLTANEYDCMSAHGLGVSL